MSTKSLRFCIFSCFIITVCCTKPIDVAPIKAEVTKHIQQFYTSFETKDMDLMSSLMAQDYSMLSFGTALTEHHAGWIEWKTAHLEQFEAIDKADIRSKNLKVYISKSGDLAWFANVTDWTMVIKGEALVLRNVRITGVLEKRDSKWKIVQIHASVPQE